MDFIGIYDDILTADECNVIIQYFNKHPDREAGKIGYGFVDPELKDSTDLYTRFTESSLTHRIIYGALTQAFERYENIRTDSRYTTVSTYSTINQKAVLSCGTMKRLIS